MGNTPQKQNNILDVTGTRSETAWPKIAKTTSNAHDYCQQHEQVYDDIELKQIDNLFGDGWSEKIYLWQSQTGTNTEMFKLDIILGIEPGMV